jgi:hypothetical protein
MSYQSKGFTITFPWSGVRDSDLSPHPEGAKVFLEFNWGRWMRPVPKPRHWFSKTYNPWFGNDPEKHWFTLDIPFAGFFFGWSWNGDGKYIGFKRFPLAHKEYRRWTEAPLGPEYSAITFSIRG